MSTPQDPPLTASDSPTAEDSLTVAERLADDPKDYSQLRRLRAVHDARERVIEQRQKAIDDFINYRRVGWGDVLLVFRDAVQNYITEIENIENIEGDECLWAEYWEKAELGEQPTPGTADPITFKGLKSIMAAPRMFTVTWEETTDHMIKGRQTDTKTETVPVEEHILMSAYRTCNEYISKLDLDLRVDQEETAELEYTNLIDSP